MEEIELMVDGFGEKHQFNNLNRTLELPLEELKLRFKSKMNLNCTNLLNEYGLNIKDKKLTASDDKE